MRDRELGGFGSWAELGRLLLGFGLDRVGLVSGLGLKVRARI